MDLAATVWCREAQSVRSMVNQVIAFFGRKEEIGK
jgi:hypothetical protein